MSPEMNREAAGQTTELEAMSLLDEIINATRPQSSAEANRTKDYFKQFLDQVVEPGKVVSKDVEKNILHWMGEIDKTLSAQLNEIMHHPDLQKLEGTWRGLNYLVQQSETGESLKIRVLNVSKKDLFKDLEKAAEFDQSLSSKRSTKKSTVNSAGSPTA